MVAPSTPESLDNQTLQVNNDTAPVQGAFILLTSNLLSGQVDQSPNLTQTCSHHFLLHCSRLQGDLGRAYLFQGGPAWCGGCRSCLPSLEDWKSPLCARPRSTPTPSRKLSPATISFLDNHGTQGRPWVAALLCLLFNLHTFQVHRGAQYLVIKG